VVKPLAEGALGIVDEVPVELTPQATEIGVQFAGEPRSMTSSYSPMVAMPGMYARCPCPSSGSPLTCLRRARSARCSAASATLCATGCPAATWPSRPRPRDCRVCRRRSTAPPTPGSRTAGFRVRCSGLPAPGRRGTPGAAGPVSRSPGGGEPFSLQPRCWHRPKPTVLFHWRRCRPCSPASGFKGRRRGRRQSGQRPSIDAVHQIVPADRADRRWEPRMWQTLMLGLLTGVIGGNGLHPLHPWHHPAPVSLRSR
jgi:hypothetical protein